MTIIRFSVAIVIAFLLSHCADLMKVLQQGTIQKPAVRVSGAKLSGLSFEQADLLFDIEITNPNAVGISLSGFDYDLLLNNNSFLKGEQDKKMEIKANDLATFPLPLSLNYENIIKTFQSLKDADDVAYTLNTGLSFDLPVLGPMRIPVSTSGKVPMLKLPKINLKSLKLTSLSFTGAQFDLAIGVNNPNSWGMIVDALQYGFSINGKQWIDGQTTRKINVDGKHDNVIQIPFSLNFLEIGSGVYNIITNGKGLNYSLTGQADLSSSMEMLGNFQLPLDLSGKIDISK